MRNLKIRPSHFDTFRPSGDSLKRSFMLEKMSGTIRNMPEEYERVDYADFGNEDRLIKKVK
mgnify:CR=1 FL=1